MSPKKCGSKNFWLQNTSGSNKFLGQEIFGSKEMAMAFFGNHISKCNKLSKNIRPIQAIEVLYRLRNKQKHYLISLVFSILSNISNNSDFLKVFLSFLLNFQRLFLVTSGTFFLFSSSSAVIFCRSCSLSSSYQYVNSKK